MKRIISILLTVAMAVTIFTGCGSAKLDRGVTDTKKYTNESIGITFTKPESWRFLSAGEIAGAMDIAKDMYLEKDLFESEDVDSVIEFISSDSATGNNINMSIERVRGRFMTAKKYAESFREILKEQVQIEYTFREDTTAMLGNIEFIKMEATCTYWDINMTQYVYIAMIGKYAISVSATTSNGMPASEFEAMFS